MYVQSRDGYAECEYCNQRPDDQHHGSDSVTRISGKWSRFQTTVRDLVDTARHAVLHCGMGQAPAPQTAELRVCVPAGRQLFVPSGMRRSQQCWQRRKRWRNRRHSDWHLLHRDNWHSGFYAAQHDDLIDYPISRLSYRGARKPRNSAWRAPRPQAFAKRPGKLRTTAMVSLEMVDFWQVWSLVAG
jgi:hypothetical protein